MKIASQELMHVYAINDFVKVESGKGILLAANLKVGQVKVMLGSTLSTDLAAMPKLQMDYDEQFVLRNNAGIAMPNIK